GVVGGRLPLAFRAAREAPEPSINTADPVSTASFSGAGMSMSVSNSLGVYDVNTTRRRSSNACATPTRSSNRDVNTSAEISGERHSENLRFSMASVFGIGLIVSGWMPLMYSTTVSSDDAVGKLSERLSLFTSQ